MPQRNGKHSVLAMSELVFSKDIELRPHAIDRYGRTVAQVGVDGKDIAVEMLRHRRLRNVEPRREVPDSGLTARQALEDGPAARVR